MAELLLKTLNHPEPEESLYDFLVESILTLEKTEIGIANFHLSFMIKLSTILGFEPNQEEENPQYFDLMNGMFTFEKPAHNHFIDQEISGILTKLINAAYNQLDEIKMTRYQRSELLNQLIDYYKLHVSGFHGLKSPDVLHEIFN
jgi:DNA repair protein RecO (recombination protein O)